jgi:hypothetical protein
MQVRNHVTRKAKSHIVPGLQAALVAAKMMDAEAETTPESPPSVGLHALNVAPESFSELERLQRLGFLFTPEATARCNEKEATAAAVAQDLQSAADASPAAAAIVARLQALETAVLSAKTTAEFANIKMQVCRADPKARPVVRLGFRATRSA